MLIYSVSQQPIAGALSYYLKADSFYREATLLNESPDYTEEKEQSLNREALVWFNKTFRSADLADSLRSIVAFKIGELEHYFENLAVALKYYQEAVRLQPQSGNADSILFKPLLYSGLIYYNQSELDSAINSFREAEKIQKKYNSTLAEGERLYNVFGVLYYETGNYIQAKNYLEKALEVLPKDHPYYKDLYTNYQINLGQINLKLENYDEANKIYQSILPLNINKAEILHNIGLINLYLGSAEKALSYFRKVKFNNPRDIRLYTNMGNAFLNLGEDDSAKLYFQKSLEVPVPANNTASTALGNTFKSMADLELQQGDHQASLELYQKAINHFYPAFTNADYRNNPKAYSGVFSYINLFHAITGKADAFHELYQRTKKAEWAKLELDAYSAAFDLVDYVEKIYDSDEARLFLNKIKYLVHDKPIDAAMELYQLTKERQYIEQLYHFDQKNKASVLSFHQQRNARGSMSPRIFSLKRDITRLTIKAASITDSAELMSVNKSVRDKEIELGKLQEEEGKNIQWSERVPPVKELQNDLLDKNTAILSYHLSESHLYILLITEEGFDVIRRQLPADFEEEFSNYVTSLYEEREVKDHAKWSKLLLPTLNEDVDRLIIIPDDELSYLPFEALRNTGGEYLLSKKSIQYQYATPLLKEEKFRYNSLTLTSFAPFTTSGNEQFPQLASSAEEIRGFNGRRYVDAKATKQQFLNEVAKTGIFHLATHASANDTSERSAYIAFYPVGKEEDHLLFASEIYSLDLRATRLVLLSACETGSGELERGEGVMSLSRSFAYAGCPNVITSLWKADDASTSYIMRRLHHHLSEGAPIDQALREAKRDYLADPKINPRRKSPAYWAHLVFIGNYQPEPNYLLLIVIMSVIVVLVAIIFLAKKTSA